MEEEEEEKEEFRAALSEWNMKWHTFLSEKSLCALLIKNLF